MTKPIIALLYDFDKTLCTTDMEDYAFIPALGYTPAEFWHKANTFGRENRMDGLLAYMYTMIAECRAQGKDLKRDFLVACGRSMELFPGVREYLIPSHQGKEPAAVKLADALQLSPVIHAGMALGEGTGAVMMFTLLDMAMSIYGQSATFSEIAVEQYKR